MTTAQQRKELHDFADANNFRRPTLSADVSQCSPRGIACTFSDHRGTAIYIKDNEKRGWFYHEMAHWLDYILRGTSDHTDEFISVELSTLNLFGYLPADLTKRCEWLAVAGISTRICK